MISNIPTHLKVKIGSMYAVKSKEQPKERKRNKEDNYSISQGQHMFNQNLRNKHY